MTGPEHYLEAERLLVVAYSKTDPPTEQIALVVQYAQVHATLALTAATCGYRGATQHAPEWATWDEVLS